MRQDLMAAALRCIEQGGIRSLSLRKLAQEAGVTTMAAYHYFANKQDILVHLALAGFSELVDSVSEELDSQPQPTEKLWAFMRIYCDFALKKPAVYQLMFGSEVPAKSRIDELNECLDRFFQNLSDLVESYLVFLSVEGDADALGIAVWGTLDGLVSLVNDGLILKELPDADLPHRMVELARAGLFHTQR